MSKLKRYRSIAILLVGMLIVLPGILVLLQVGIEPKYGFRLGDLISGNTRLRFRHCDLSAESRLSPVRKLVGGGQVCDAMIVNGSCDHCITAAVQTSDRCERLKGYLLDHDIETLEVAADGGQNFDLDLQCGRDRSGSARAFAGQIRWKDHKLGVKGYFDEQSGWVLVIVRRQ